MFLQDGVLKRRRMLSIKVQDHFLTLATFLPLPLFHYLSYHIFKATVYLENYLEIGLHCDSCKARICFPSSEILRLHRSFHLPKERKLIQKGLKTT
jgi:hypothetical protein